MPRSPTGNSSVPITFAPDTPAKATEVNANFTDVAAQLTDSLSRTGLGGMLSPLDMGGYKVQNAGAPTAAGDLVTKGFADSNYATSATLANYVLKATPAMTGNPVITNEQPGIQLVESDASNKTWYSIVTSSSFIISETNTTTPRLSIAPGGVVTIAGSLTLGTPLAVAQGGIGANNAAAGRTNLDLGTMATQNAASVAITGGSGVFTSLSTSGNFTASGSVTASGGIFTGASTTILSTPAAGNIALRPNGPASPTNQAVLSSNGDFGISGTFSAPTVTSTGNVNAGSSALQANTGVTFGSSLTGGNILSHVAAAANGVAANVPNLVGQIGTGNIGNTSMMLLTVGEINPGQLVAGSSLRYCSADGVAVSGITVSGIWQANCYLLNSTNKVGLFTKVSG